MYLYCTKILYLLVHVVTLMEEEVRRRPGRPVSSGRIMSWSTAARARASSRVHEIAPFTSASCSAPAGADECFRMHEREQERHVQEPALLVEAPRPAPRLQIIASLLWMPDYGQLFEAEVAENEVELGVTAWNWSATTYSARLSGDA